MASSQPAGTFVSENVYCRPADWVDVGKFILLNYALHTLTTVPIAGAGAIWSIFRGLTAFFSPLAHISGAAVIIERSLVAAIRGKRGILETALRAEALCMVVKYTGNIPDDVNLRPGSLRMQLFVPLVLSLSQHAQSDHILDSHGKPKFKIANNRSIMKTLAAIIQIVYGAKELYDARGRQIQHYGYAAYSFTIIPYLLMSFLNLIAMLGEPQYPALYLVHLRTHSDIPPVEGLHGTVGTVRPPFECSPPRSSYVAWSHVQHDIDDTENDTRQNIQRDDQRDIQREDLPKDAQQEIQRDAEKNTQQSDRQDVHQDTPKTPHGSVSARPSYDSDGIRVGRAPPPRLIGPFVFMTITICIFYGLPYVIIYHISGFTRGESTTSQRVWTMLWIISGQVSVLISLPFLWYINVNSHLTSGASIGGLITVIKMILDFGICKLV
ncbi:hypothetical protein K440DRAFT_637392 [Wilcoxina mikolae CBS 423.85]|nr:hypothetical protein K440DRAFT_637392 [Wilcoxina mikolae CBS 423.85]